MRAKVTKADCDDLDADERVGVVNNFMYSLFKKVDVFLKEKQVTQATGTSSYHDYLETLLNYGPAEKESQLISAMFYKDTAGKMNVSNPVAAGADGNKGLATRYTFSKLSQTIEMAGPIFCDVFMSEGLLLSFVDLKIILNRSDNDFCLIASEDGADYRLKLTEAYLKLLSSSKPKPLCGQLTYFENRTCNGPKAWDWSKALHSVVPTKRIPTTFKIWASRSSVLRSMEKKFPSKPFNYLLLQQRPDILKPTALCFPAQEKCFTIQETKYHEKITPTVTLYMHST